MYLKIVEGDEEGGDLRPVFVTSDAELIAEVGQLLARRLGAEAASADGQRLGRVLKLDPPDAEDV